MHTIMVMAGGLLLLAVCVLIGRFTGGMVKGALAFNPLWLISVSSSEPWRIVVGNLEPSLDLYPDRPAPVVRNRGNGVRELAKLTWGMPTPEMLLKPGAPDTGVTNVRKTWLPHWQQWLAVENRCVVPATSFCEYSQTPDPMTKKKPKVWFAIDESQPLFFFAGIWTTWSGGAWLDENAARGGSRAVRIPDLQSEWHRRADPSQGDAGASHS